MNHQDILLGSGFAEVELSGGTLSVTTPIDGSEIACLKMHSVPEVEAMIERGSDAFKKWRSVPAPRRGELVRLLGEELRIEKN